MSEPSRRDFLKATAPIAASIAAIQPGVFAVGAEEKKKLRIAMIGCGGRAKSLASAFQKHAKILYACDPDLKRAKEMLSRTNAAQTTNDLREVLTDDSVDAVVIATPDHWHAPAAILACNAGKHVYVEKPCSHNLVEGKLLVEAARKNNVVVQHGTQSRTNPLIANAIQLIKEGIIGDVLISKAWNVQRRRNIGHASPEEAPEDLDYDLWLGPAESMPYQSNRLHYNWHWWHNFGTGDIGNDGVHEIDYARWGLGVEGLPTLVSGIGGKYYFDDDQQFPDSVTCSFEWPGNGSVGSRKQLIFEMRIWSTSYPNNCDNGVEFYGTKGRMFLSKRGKIEIYNEKNQRVTVPEPKEKVTLAASHQLDLLNCIHTGEVPQAEIEIGHGSSALAHLANATVRLGRSIKVDPKTQTALDDSEANALLGRTYRSGGHWAIPEGSSEA